jgi:hypothetical protein
MRRRLFSLLAGARGPSVVASVPMKLLFVLWLLSGHRPAETSTGSDLDRLGSR